MDKNFRLSDGVANARNGASELGASELGASELGASELGTSELDLGTRMAAAEPLGARAR
jgi:hypothetical protein